MTKQLIFALILLVTLGVFTFTINRIISYFRFTKDNIPVRNLAKRFGLILEVAFGQTKIFRKPVTG
ncbi:MAG: hypothetical protein ABIK52_05105, partial [Bacteroidota bacterium]